MTNSRTKGAAGEREAARLWQRWFPNARRSFGQARKGYEQPDIIHCKPYYIEVKRYAEQPTQAQLTSWWNKLVNDWILFEKINGDPIGWDPVLMWREDYGLWWVGMWGVLARQLGPLAEPHIEDSTRLTTSWEDFARCMDEIHLVHEINNP